MKYLQKQLEKKEKIRKIDKEDKNSLNTSLRIFLVLIFINVLENTVFL